MNERALFDAALEYDNPVERAAFLDRACGRDLPLRRRLASLLDALPRLGGFLEAPLHSHEAPRDISPAGDRIGSYKLLEPIGEGGFGVVYLAEQLRPVKRRVAVKVLKPGMDSREVLARFDAERQALAMMDHPNIARVLDGGATDEGRPYFVMDLVRGAPITEYCDQNKLSLEERLSLFTAVCRAIQHAHQKGVIHRDVKPSNVLVTFRDGEAVPKVIDFGVAKAIDARLTDATMFTRLGQIVGTLEYMSPEQAEMGGLDIDTRSDVYSLGVLLYELVTGATPLSAARQDSPPLDEILRAIRQDEPMVPSQQLLKAKQGEPASGKPGGEIRRLASQVRGELDWVIMKSLEKSRARRYSSASELADDVQRFLNREPVSAGPPSPARRMRRLASRRRGLLLASGALLVVATAAPWAIWQAVRASHAQGIADRKQEEVRAARLASASAGRALLDTRRKLSAERIRTQQADRQVALHHAHFAAQQAETARREGRLQESLHWLMSGFEGLEGSPEQQAFRWAMAAIWPETPIVSAVSPSIGSPSSKQVVVCDRRPDGRLLVFSTEAEGPRTLRLLAPDGEELWSIPAPSGLRPSSLRFCAGDALLGIVDGLRVERWSVTGGQPVGEPIMLDELGWSQISVSGTGERLFILSSDRRRASLLEVPSGGTLRETVADEGFQFLPPLPGAGPFSPRGESMALLMRSAAETRLSVWNAHDGQDRVEPVLLAEDTHRELGSGYAVGPGARWLVVVDRSAGEKSAPAAKTARLRIIGAHDGAPLGPAFGDAASLRAVAVSPTGAEIALAVRQPSRNADHVEVWFVAEGDPRGIRCGPPVQIERLRFAADGRLTVLGDSPVLEWSIPAPRARRALMPHSAPIHSLATTPKGDIALVIAGRQAVRWRISSGQKLSPVVTLPLASDSHRAVAAFRPDGRRLAVGDGDLVTQRDTDSGQIVAPPIRMRHDVRELTYDASGQRIMCISAIDQTKAELEVFDAATGQSLGPPITFLCIFDWDARRSGIVRGVAALSPDGMTVSATARLSRLRRWRIGEAAPEEVQTDASGELTAARFLAGGQKILLCVNGLSLEVRDVASGKQVGPTIELASPLRAWAVDATGEVAATATDTGVQCWHLGAGQPLGQEIPCQRVASLCFARGAELLLIGDEDGLVQTFLAFSELPGRSWERLTLQSLTGMRLSPSGRPERLDSDWLHSRRRERELPQLAVSATIDPLPRPIAAAFAAHTPQAAAPVQAELERLASASQDGLAMLARERMAGGAAPSEDRDHVAAFLQSLPQVERAAWTMHLVRQAHNRQQPSLAFDRLEAALSSGLEDSALRLMRAELFASAARAAEAVHDLQKAVEAEPEDAALLRSAALVAMSVAEWKSAEAWLGKAIALSPDAGAEVWRLRAQCRAELSQWSLAAEDLAEAHQRHPMDIRTSEQLAVALVSAGMLDEYRQLCAQTLASWDLDDYRKRPWTAPRLFVLAPDGLDDFEPILAPAREFAARYRNDCVTFHIFGPYGYRAGLFEEAARAVPPPGSQQPLVPLEIAFLAMAEARLGNRQGVEERLNQLEKLPWRDQDVWERQMIVLLLSEAGLNPMGP